MDCQTIKILSGGWRRPPDPRQDRDLFATLSYSNSQMLISATRLCIAYTSDAFISSRPKTASDLGPTRLLRPSRLRPRGPRRNFSYSLNAVAASCSGLKAFANARISWRTARAHRRTC